MPLWRFKAGDFTSPIEEATGLEPTIISLAETPGAQPPWHLRWLAAIGLIEFDEPLEETATDRSIVRTQARQQVGALKAELSQLTTLPVDWEDEGAVYYNKQFHASGFLRGFAAWQDHRDVMPEFLPAPPGRDTNHYPVWDLPEPALRRFPTLTKHSLHTGYLVPALFEGVYKVEPFKAFGHWEMHHDVASSQAMLRETEGLLMLIAELKAVGDSAEHVKMVQAAQDWTEELHKICLLSVGHKVPVIFYG